MATYKTVKRECLIDFLKSHSKYSYTVREIVSEMSKFTPAITASMSIVLPIMTTYRSICGARYAGMFTPLTVKQAAG